MCGFIITNQNEINENSNRYIKNRGPDLVKQTKIKDITVIHSLLSITGETTPQPFYDKNKDIICTFNGEVYNYKSFGDFKSDGECLIPTYEKFGENFASQLDGEFGIAIVDRKEQKLIISTDVFATKPVWLGIKNEKEFMVCSYESGLICNNYDQRYKIYANKTIIVSLKDMTVKKVFDNKKFSLDQHKESYEDWCAAFERAVIKRSSLDRENCFIGLSSGYDSGAISCVLNNHNLNYTAYSILGAENEDILKKREEIIEDFYPVSIDQEIFLEEKKFLSEECEDFKINGKSTARNDKASAGLSLICRIARKENKRIYLSGQGADEIISDYGFNGHKFYGHSQFGGLFPNDLSKIFPWNSFYEGTQLKYINKEECVAGSHGIEARYPFLDFDLVQEFLWLKPELKNRAYKAPIDYLLEKNDYPFEKNKKIGFRPNHQFKNR